MRLWHKDLIPVLPDKQLIGQYRELCCIAKNIAEKGTPNHLLVNKVLNYPIIHFICYSDLVLNEMKNRNIKINEESYSNFAINCNKASVYFPALFNKDILIKNTEDIYSDWMDMRYFLQCYYNLEEKYDCGGIPVIVWNYIQELYDEKLIDWREEIHKRKYAV